MSSFLSVNAEVAVYAIGILFLLSYALLAGNRPSRRDTSARASRMVLS